MYFLGILGTVHGAGSAATTTGVVGSAVGPSLGYIGRRLQVSFCFKSNNLTFEFL